MVEQESSKLKAGGSNPSGRNMILSDKSYFNNIISYRTSRNVKFFGLNHYHLGYHICFYKKKKKKFLIFNGYRNAMKRYYAYPTDEDFTYTYSYTYSDEDFTYTYSYTYSDDDFK